MAPAPIETCAALASDADQAERAADRDVAFSTYQRLFWAALEAGLIAHAVDALRGQSRICQQRQRFEEAEEFAHLSLEIAERNGLISAAARAINTLAAIRFFEHDWHGASELYGMALQCATDCGDDALIGWTCQNLGMIAHLQGGLHQARFRYLESVASSVRSGDGTTAMAAYNSLGMISADMEEWIDSMLYFDRGLELAEQFGSVGIRATMLANRAEPLIFIGEADRALTTLRESEELALDIGDQRTLAEINRFRAVICRIQRRAAEAEEYLSRALQIADAAGLNLERAEAMEELARLRWQEGRAGSARATAREALREYRRLGAEYDAGRLQRLLTEWRPVPSP